MGCLFCDFINGRLDASRIVYEDGYILAFKEIKNPKAYFHVLIIPRYHIECAADIHDKNSFLIAKTYEAAANIAQKYNLDHYKLITNSGDKAGQSVFHLHHHMLSGIEPVMEKPRLPCDEPCTDCRFVEELQYRASTDIMTGAYNREWGLRLLEQKLAEPDTAGSLAFLDIDGLKRTNDTHGHAAGDELLREAVRMIRNHIPEDAILCRWGGDEFLLYVKLPPEEAEALAGWIQGDMNRMNTEDGRAYRLSFSYGIVPFIHGMSLDALVTEADQRMYLNKTDKYGQRRRWSDKV